MSTFHRGRLNTYVTIYLLVMESGHLRILVLGVLQSQLKFYICPDARPYVTSLVSHMNDPFGYEHLFV